MLTDKDNLLRRLHALRSEHRDLDTVIARITEHLTARHALPAELVASIAGARALVEQATG